MTKPEASFFDSKPIIGMVHLLALPESPGFGGSVEQIYTRALREAAVLEEAGVDALIVENFGDEPHQIGNLSSVPAALMAALLREVVGAVSIPVGVNVQFNAWEQEMALAYACGASFIRAEVFVDTVVMAQGIVHPCCVELTRMRKRLGADVQIWAGVQTKYTQNLVPQPLTQSAKDAVSAGADALIVTGAATGAATPLESVAAVKEVVHVPVVVGSGTTIDNVEKVLEIADGAIVGSALKEGGSAWNEVSREAAEAFMHTARSRG